MPTGATRDSRRTSSKGPAGRVSVNSLLVVPPGPVCKRTCTGTGRSGSNSFIASPEATVRRWSGVHLFDACRRQRSRLARHWHWTPPPSFRHGGCCPRQVGWQQAGGCEAASPLETEVVGKTIWSDKTTLRRGCAGPRLSTPVRLSPSGSRSRPPLSPSVPPPEGSLLDASGLFEMRRQRESAKKTGRFRAKALN
jgi:hypothetical protein